MKNYYRRNQLDDIDLEKNDHFRNNFSEGFEKVTVAEGASGNWKVKKFEVIRKEAGLYNLRLIRDGQRRRVVPLGWYTRLSHRGKVVMSDTPAESHENAPAYRAATGRVLVNGLGLGFVLQAILRKPEVTHVTVIEKSTDVIRLVKPSVTDRRVRIVRADATTWRPARGEKFDVVWHDIWSDIDEDNRKEMTMLKRAYGRCAGWQGCWSEEYLR